MKKTFCLILVIVLALFCAVSHAEIKAWSTMKNFRVKTMDGQTFDLYQTLQSKELVLIDLWYVHCGSCAYAAGSLEMVYREYQDRVGFISINPYDNQKAVNLYTTARGLTYPCARYSSAKRWTQWYPWFILVGKNGQVLYSFSGSQSPGELRNLLDWGLSLTDADKAQMAATQTEFYPTGEADNKTWAKLNCYAYVYNMMNNMTLQVSGPDVRRIVVDDNLRILQCNDHVGEFYIAPRGTTLQVTVTTDKNVNPRKAYMCSLYDWENKNPFSKAKSGKNQYTFQIVTETSPDGRLFAASGDIGSITEDSQIGFMCFFSEEEAERYFSTQGAFYGCSFPWHVE